MAEITSIGPIRHLRAENTSHVLCFQNAKLVRSGRGLSFWFRPYATSVAEVPVDDRELALVCHGRSADFQDIVAQGVITFRIVDPVAISERVDFTVDLKSGALLKQPLEKIALLLAQLANQHALTYIGTTPIRDILTHGYERIRAAIEEALTKDAGVKAMGVAVVAVRVSSLKPSADLEKALEAPTREHLQQVADQAAFARRALAVEKERAIQENELQNQIELARREEQLIAQRGQNSRREATESAEAERIKAEGESARSRLQGLAQAESIKAVEGSRLAIEQARMQTYRDMAPAVLAALAARELAGKLQKIEHLNITPDALTPLLAGLASSAQKSLDTKK